MATPLSDTEQALKQLEDQLSCSSCLNFYTEPKLLQCFHVFCKQCLEQLVVQDCQGPSLQCPSCRRSTLLPPTGVLGLQTAFYLNSLFDIQKILENIVEKAKNKSQCVNCEKCVATSFCHNCGKYLCTACNEVHQRWKEFSSHKVITLDQLEKDVVQLVPSKEETKSLHHLDTQCQQITDQQEALAGNIDKTIRQLQETLEVWKTKLNGLLYKITHQKPETQGYQTEETAADFKDMVLEPQERAASTSCTTEFTQTFQQNLGTSIKTIHQLNSPWDVAVNQRGDIIVVEQGGHCISIFSPSREKIRTFGSKGSAQGQFNGPCGVAVDGDCNILVADTENHRIQKFTADGKFLAEGCYGKDCLQFSNPTAVAVNHRNRKMYVCDQRNHRIQILNADLTFSNSFGSHGSGDGQFNCPRHVALDGAGNVYVADSEAHRIQMFTAEGDFLRKFKKKGSDGELNFPTCVSVGSDDVVYVSERNHCVSMFTREGEFQRSFGTWGDELGSFKDPRGIAVDRGGQVYVSDAKNHRIQILQPGIVHK